MGAYGSPTLTNNDSVKWEYCWKCGANIQPHTKICPHCKAKQKHNSNFITKFFAFLGIIFSIGVILSLFSNDLENPISEPVQFISKEEYANNCIEYTYEDLARTPTEYEGKYVKLSGKVTQVTEYGNKIVLLIDVSTSYDSKLVYCTYTYKNNEPKILEKDNLLIYGVANNTYTYTTVLGASKTVPFINIGYWELISK